MQRTGSGAMLTGGPISCRGGVGVGALLAPGFLDIRNVADDLLGRQSHPLLADGTNALRLLRTWKEERGEWWQRLPRLVGLSQLGWAFASASVLWSLFAFEFSLSAGWGWNKGAPFFALGLGVLVFGFFLRKGPQHRALSAAFLAVNAVVPSCSPSSSRRNDAEAGRSGDREADLRGQAPPLPVPRGRCGARRLGVREPAGTRSQ